LPKFFKVPTPSLESRAKTIRARRLIFGRKLYFVVFITHVHFEKKQIIFAKVMDECPVERLCSPGGLKICFA